MYPLRFLIFLLFVLFYGCAQTPNNINWNDRRCVTYSNFFQKMKNQNNGTNTGAAFAALLDRNRSMANAYLNGGTIEWVEGFSGDSQKVWVGYNQLGENVGYKDIKNTDLTLADLDRLGGVVTKYSNIGEMDSTYQMKKMTAEYSQNRGKPFLAAPMPNECMLVK